MNARLALVSSLLGALLWPGLVSAAPSIDQRAKELVQRWVASQNKGDFAAYSALYAPSFQGVRRSHLQTVDLDHDRWLRDRARMFKTPMKVTVDSVVVTAGPPIRVDLVQSFDSGRFEDRGRKRMKLIDRDGQLLIDYEEMLESLLPDGPASGHHCKTTKLGAGGGDVVLEACVVGERAKADYGVDQKWKTTISHAGDSATLAELASGWEWDDSWRLVGVMTSTTPDREQAVVLQHVLEDYGDEAAFQGGVEIRALAHGMPTIWSSHDTLVGAQVSIEGDHVAITARHVPLGTKIDERIMASLLGKPPVVTKLAYKKDKIVETR